MFRKSSFSVLCTFLAGVLPTQGFVSRSVAGQQFYSQQTPLTFQSVANLNPCRTRTSLYVASLWKRLEIQEDEEPMWYLLNCVAGLELDLLGLCRHRCADMEGVVKFVVPMESLTRSHGENRMLTEHMTKYPGYVFAKLRLCEETYNAIQSLDLCRSWMGNVNYKRTKKLPPAPVALNIQEIENFGLEGIQEGNEDGQGETWDEDWIIVDTEEQDVKDSKPKVNEDHLKDFLGLKVNDMIKVTAKNKFHGEDGFVKRLKAGKLFIRFTTYGSSYSEWLDPHDVRKLSDEEVLRGLSGPTTPIFQREFDGEEGGRGYVEGNRREDSGRDLRSNLMNSLGGERGDRNRRVDRVERGDNVRRDMTGEGDDERKRDRQQGANLSNGDWNNRPGFQRDQTSNQANADGQWGRPAQINPRNGGPVGESQAPREKNRQVQNAISGDDDWSKFVSPVSSSSSTEKDDNFFSSLMSNLSNNAEKKDTQKGPSKRGDDDFFASLMSELESEKKQIQPPQQKMSPGKGVGKKEDDFFAALEAELGTFDSQPLHENDGGDDFFAKLEAEMKLVKPKAGDISGRLSSDDDDFFSALENEMTASQRKSAKPPKAADISGQFSKGDDDFFAALENEMDTSESKFENSKSAEVSGSGDGDFFAALESELASFDTDQSSYGGNVQGFEEFDLGDVFGSADDETRIVEKKSAMGSKASLVTSTSSKGTKSKAPPSISETSSSPGDLGKCTISVLKVMLKEKGLKVTGNKSELIARLQTAA